MEFNLTTEQKIEALNKVKIALSGELFNTVLMVGLDPDDFDPLTWEAPDLPANGHIQRLKELVGSYNIVISKLELLS